MIYYHLCMIIVSKEKKIMSKTQTSVRNGAVDFWRFVFSVMIAHFHSSNMTDVKEIPFIGAGPAVEFFFLVSGFLMAQSLSKHPRDNRMIGRDSRNYLLHKIRGLCPEVFIAWGIGFVVQHIAKKQVTIASLVKDLMAGVWDLFFLRESGLAGFVANPAAWYISAMLLAMLILVPLFLKNPDMFLNVWAPVIAIASLGYLYQNVGNLRGPTDWLGLCYKGLLRAAAELCIGAVCWCICQKLKAVRFSKPGKILLAMLEFGCYFIMLLWCYGHKGSKMDFVMLLLLAVGVTVTFSSQGILADLFQRPAIYFLGKISLPLYLGHNYWSHALPRIFPEQTYMQLYPKYAAVTVLTTAVIYWTSKGIRAAAPWFFRKCRELLIEAPVLP